jgi:putative membrane protein
MASHFPRFPLLVFTVVMLIFILAAPASRADHVSDFVDDASAKGLAEVKTAQLALEKGKSADIKQFAQQMIEDHSNANAELTALARSENIKVADEATLMDKAKALLLKQQDGKDFDAAYADSQVTAHQQTLELFSDYAKSGNNLKIKAFAENTLPTLQHHLEMAKALKAKHPEPE